MTSIIKKNIYKKKYERTREIKIHGKGGVRGQESVNDRCRTEEGSRMKVEATRTCALNSRGRQRTEYGQSQAVVTDFLDPLLLLVKIFVFHSAPLCPECFSLSFVTCGSGTKGCFTPRSRAPSHGAATSRCCQCRLTCVPSLRRQSTR